MQSIELTYREGSRVTEESLVKIAQLADEYKQHLKDVVDRGGYEAEEASLNLCDDASMQNTVAQMVMQKKSKTLKYIFVIGIGGSNLGTYAIYNALRGAYSELVHTDEPKMVFIDTVSTTLIQTVQKIIREDITSADDVCINLISKSGTTTETIALFEIVYAALQSHFPAMNQRVVATTDEGSLLHQSATEKGFAVLFLPKKVGGRYSVFSAVGLFPLALAGVDTSALIGGACVMRARCLEDELQANPALASAVLVYNSYAQGIHINNSFFFNPELEMLGKWYRQLMGESIGKEYDADGKKAHAGITPIVSIGSTDLHSMAQLYLGGPKDKLTCFIYATPLQHEIIPTERVFPELVKSISGKNLDEIMRAIYGGVSAAYRNNALPYMEISLPEITAETLGQYLQLKMMEMMYLAHLMHVNAFDQPNVEDYKAETSKLL